MLGYRPKGRKLEVIDLPLTSNLSHMNFYIGNDCVLVPITGNRAEDDKPMGILRELFEDYDVIGMDATVLGEGGGGIHCIITVLRERLMPLVRPKYVIDVEELVYVERTLSDRNSNYCPDVSNSATKAENQIGSNGTTSVREPVECYIPIPVEVTERFLTVRLKDGPAVVTVFEVLSPANKRPGADGYDQYIRKREELLHSNAHFVEIDLLRGGTRMPLLGAVPKSDFFAIVSRSLRRPRVDVYAWNLSEPMPVIPIPLADQDPDVMLDLQEAMSTVYDRAGYDYSLDYDQSVSPKLDEHAMHWISGLLRPNYKGM